jgi:uncharacterized damage-inducible protein DinB
MHDYLRRLFEYDYWANSRVIENLESVNQKEQPLKYFSHVLGSQDIWLARLHGQDTTGRSPWFNWQVSECEAKVEELKKTWKKFLEGLKEEELQNKISYKNPQGLEFESKIGDILTHVIIHSAYHRAQVAQAIRSSGQDPAITDFIRFARKQ